MIQNKISVVELKKEQNKSCLELEFLALIKMLKLPIPATEFKFEGKRNRRFDFAYVHSKIAIELEGGTRKKGGGRHNRPDGYKDDCDKYNQAQFLGWQVYRFVNAQEAVFFVEKLVKNKMICFKILD